MDSTPYGSRQASVEYWSTHRNSLDELYPSEKHFFLDCLKESRSVLDVGCAAGGFSRLCRSVVPDLSYTGLDVSPNLIETASREHPGAGNHFYTYDGRDFPQEVIGNTYDLVYSFGVLHHVEHWAAVLEQMINAAGYGVCFDLRLSYAGSVNGEQIIDFNEEWDGVTKIDYLVLDFYETLRTIKNLIGEDDRLELYGYECGPTDKARIDADKVVMGSFCIRRKDRDGPRLAVSIQ